MTTGSGCVPRIHSQQFFKTNDTNTTNNQNDTINPVNKTNSTNNNITTTANNSTSSIKMANARTEARLRVPDPLMIETASLSEDSSGLNDNNGNNNYLGMIPLSIIIFYSVSGGPFGMEACVRAAGPFYSILGFMLMPFVWAIPESLITAELGAAFSDASAGVAWVEEAFGPFAGWMAGYLGWVGGATDNAIYPVLFLDYLLTFLSSETDQISWQLRFVLVASTSTVLAYINWRGLQVVGNLSVVVCILTLLPILVMCFIGLFKIDSDRWFIKPEGSTSAISAEIAENDDDDEGGLISMKELKLIHWGPFLNNLFWNLNSFDAAASFAEDVRDPGSVLPRAMFFGVILVIGFYLGPLLIALGATDATQSDWIDGYLAEVGRQIGGKWLEGWIVFAAGLSNLALFQAELSGDAFQLMGMANRAFVPKIFAVRSRHDTPTYSILLGLIVIVIMGAADLSQLIEMLNFNYAVALLMEYAAFLQLRISKPHMPRPYRVPLSTLGCFIFIILPPFLATGLVMALAQPATYLFTISTNLVGFLIYYVYRLRCNMPKCNYSIIADGPVIETPDTFADEVVVRY